MLRDLQCFLPSASGPTKLHLLVLVHLSEGTEFYGLLPESYPLLVDTS